MKFALTAHREWTEPRTASIHIVVANYINRQNGNSKCFVKHPIHSKYARFRNSIIHTTNYYSLSNAIYIWSSDMSDYSHRQNVTILDEFKWYQSKGYKIQLKNTRTFSFFPLPLGNLPCKRFIFPTWNVSVMFQIPLFNVYATACRLLRFPPILFSYQFSCYCLDLTLSNKMLMPKLTHLFKHILINGNIMTLIVF